MPKEGPSTSSVEVKELKALVKTRWKLVFFFSLGQHLELSDPAAGIPDELTSSIVDWDTDPADHRAFLASKEAKAEELDDLG